MDLVRVRRWPWQRQSLSPRRLLDRLADPADDLLALFVQEAASGIAIIDRRGSIVRVNDALRRMTNAVDPVSAGRPIRNLFAAECQEELWANVTAALGGHRRPGSFVAGLAEAGSAADQAVEVTILPVREVDGGVSGAILQLNDITAQRHLEAQLAQSQKLQAVGQLAGGIAHDFNNLLTAVLGAADEALARMRADDEIAEDLEQIRGSAQRGAALVRQLLAFGRHQCRRRGPQRHTASPTR
jgi:two-component system cell cycle sensor histidine kinase/response regulator CckA